MTSSCQCQTGRRTLVLHAPNMTSVYGELIDFQPGGEWQPEADRDLVRVTVEPESRFASGAAVVNFLRGVIDEPRLRGLRAAWHDHACGEVQLPADIDDRMKPLLTLLPGGSSPLMDILTQRRIDTWFQPIFRADSGRVWGYECLMRGRAEDDSQISPAQLLEWARQENLLFMLDRICRETHLDSAAACGVPEDAKLLINFLPTAIYDPRFCLRSTEAAAKRNHIDPGRVIFEVVESEEVRDREHLTNILAYYRQAGYGFALDDVGAGYAGLMMLADLDPDLIKIDRALVTRAVDSHLHRTICASLAAIAREHNKLILAEGVETLAEKAVMDDIGVDLYQGFLFAKPAPHVIRDATLRVA